MDFSIPITVLDWRALLVTSTHIVPVKTYLFVFISLLCLALLTTGVAFVLQMEQGHVGSCGAFTVRDTAVLGMLFNVAVIFELPASIPVANPVPLMVAKVVLEDVQVTWLVMFCVLLS